jgi:hypothetical protein
MYLRKDKGNVIHAFIVNLLCTQHTCACNKGTVYSRLEQLFPLRHVRIFPYIIKTLLATNCYQLFVDPNLSDIRWCLKSRPHRHKAKFDLWDTSAWPVWF